jgi:nicotinate-nucleotide pyrophosphorylase (carboxylating)
MTLESLTDDTSARLVTAGLDATYVLNLVTRAIEEDLDGGVDVTSVATVPFDQESTADLVARADGVVAGLPVAAAVFEVATDDAVVIAWLVEDGARVSRGDVLMSLTAATRGLLTGERTALNLLCRLSGIATLTRQWVDAVEGTGAAVRDTRKTTPGLRVLEKYAVRCGGGVNHRMSLSDAAMVKDNHVVAAGGVAEAFRAVRAAFPDVPVEVEGDSVDDVLEAVEAGADLVLLDNMSVAEMRRAVELVAGRARLEASGGLRLDNAREVAETGVDYLAVGALTHSAPVLDIACDLRERS